ncbi:START domain, Homeodomain-like, MEKHLA, START-like domain protein [Artemisia annua]|uniref:START domain, Homeodomain-like, MEKHLA, START-like domain protein n=1 Tax=Artemisia annua TaxID=35608 RepID=A0A2U1P7S9_ARTAN|nr:START domain, Homeodomain-like, MEKHLA, START-like domain protein [Artemisia annua]
MAMSCKDGKGEMMDNGKYVRYTPEQVEALEKLYHDCPKPSSVRRQQLIRECPILSNIEPKQIKVWFQNRRCREKQRKEASRLQTVNRKLTAMNKLLMEENDRLQKQVSHLVYENGHFRQHTQKTALGTKDTSCESVVTNGQNRLTPQHPPRDASPAGLMSIAEETLTEFLSKATGTAIEWVQMPGMKPGPDSIGIVAISHGCTGVAARACGLVALEPTRVVEILKDRPLWFRDCRAVDVLNVLPTANGGTIEILYMQLYAPTTLATARDFLLLRYTSVTEDGSLVVCERSLHNTQNGPSIPSVPNFVRAQMLPSGYLIRPYEGGGSIIHIVDHMNLEAWSVPEVLRPLYESSTVLAQKTTMMALRQLRQIALEVSQSGAPSNWGRRPAALRALSQRLNRGFNEALNGFTDEGWSLMTNDGVDDVTIIVNSSPQKLMGLNLPFTNGYPSVSNSVLCAKASMLLQNVPPALLLRFLREHRSEWADNNIDAYAAAAVKLGPCNLPGTRVGNFGGQVILPLAHTIEHEELLEVIKMEGVGHCPEDALMPRDMFLLQVCNGMDENAVGMCSELIFAPIDASFADDAPLVPSGFRIIPLDSIKDGSSPNRTLDLASALEIRGSGNKISSDLNVASGTARSVMTIAFEFVCESHMQETVAAIARQYVRNIISSVQRVASALSPNTNLNGALQAPLGTPEAHVLASWISRSYSCYLGGELLKTEGERSKNVLKSLWSHSDAIMCCSLKALPVFTFANQAGLDMLETTLVALQDISLEKVLDEHGRKGLFTEFAQIMQQGFTCLQGGVCSSSMGRPVSYERAVAWKVLNDEEDVHCVCFMFINWSFV